MLATLRRLCRLFVLFVFVTALIAVLQMKLALGYDPAAESDDPPERGDPTPLLAVETVRYVNQTENPAFDADDE